jgi:hypothetical protein
MQKNDKLSQTFAPFPCEAGEGMGMGDTVIST